MPFVSRRRGAPLSDSTGTSSRRSSFRLYRGEPSIRRGGRPSEDDEQLVAAVRQKFAAGPGIGDAVLELAIGLGAGARAAYVAPSSSLAGHEGRARSGAR
jgi:hypothetical protein